MPTYDYECKKCKNTFEAFQSIVEKPLTRCPECQGKVKRCIGAGAGVIFKGSGFYETDYRSENYKKAAKAEKTAESGAGKNSGAKSGESSTK